jgi:hypothetical protein
VRELTGATTVHPLTGGEWTDAFAQAAPALPFAAPHWTRWGGMSAPARRFTPVLLRLPTGDLLVPLFRSGTDGQLGGFGYGMICPTTSWRGVVPPFAAFAAAACAATGLTGLRTLLPPAELDRLTAHWTGAHGRPTYVLDLAGGPERVWATARGSVRTAIRRAEQHGVHVVDARPADAGQLRELYRETLGRNGNTVANGGPDLTFLVAGGSDVVTVVARGDAIQAVSAFAVGAGVGYHVLQVTSQVGRDTNAGHLALLAALERLASAGVHTVDLGSAASAGQARFKQSWGAVERHTRLLRWRSR